MSKIRAMMNLIALVSILFMNSCYFVQGSVSMDPVPVTISDSFVINDLNRIIDLTTGTTTSIITELTISGSDKKKSDDKFMITVPVDEADVTLAFMAATGSSSSSVNGKQSELKVTKKSFDAKRQYQLYEVKLPYKLKDGESFSLIIKETHVALLKPFPKQIPQLEAQKLLYNGPLYFTSPYPCKTQKISFKLDSSSKLISYSEDVEPVTKNQNMLVYGPINEVEAFRASDVKIHFHSNQPLLLAKTRHVTYEFSHWGDILSVDEKYDLYHRGALLKGQFGRMEMMLRYAEHTKTAMVSELAFEIPKNSKNVYFRDYVGNVSTSSLRKSGSKKILVLNPRYPIFGGWKYSWFHGYHVPLHEYVSKNMATGSYIANIPFVEKATTDIAVQKNHIKIILPEGASNIKVKLPFSVDVEEKSWHYTYLDTVGRPVVLLEKQNIVQDHRQNVVITYDLDTTTLFYKPIACTVAFFLIFLTSIAYIRSDFSLSKDPKAEAALKLTCCVSDVTKYVKDAQKTLSSLENEFASFKEHKDAKIFNSARDSIESKVQNDIKQIELSVRKANALVQEVPRAAKFINNCTAIISHLKDILANEKKKHGDMISLLKDLSSGKVDDAKKKATIERTERVDQENSGLKKQIEQVLKSF